MRRTWCTVLCWVVVMVGMTPCVVWAGDTDSPAGPDDPASAMPTMKDVYQRLTIGADYTLRTTFSEPVAGPGATGVTLQKLMNAAPVADNSDGAVASEVLAGKAYWGIRTDGGGWGLQTGTRSPAPVGKTGQTTCYNAAGTVIACAGTGQDGDLRPGVAWPNPRFTNNSNGTVTDNLTGLIWLRDASCADLAGTNSDGRGVWTTALTASAALASGTCGLTDSSSAGDWRLPSVNELQSLVDYRYSIPTLSNAAGTGKWLEGDAFSGVLSQYYWSSTSYAIAPASAWGVLLSNGLVGDGGKAGSACVWPVRGGQ